MDLLSNLLAFSSLVIFNLPRMRVLRNKRDPHLQEAGSCWNNHLGTIFALRKGLHLKAYLK